MSHITLEQLAHLAKLSRIQLTAEDTERLLPQLEHILTFVGQLDEVEFDETELEDEMRMLLSEGVVESDITQAMLANVQHPIVHHSIQIANQLSEAT